MFFGTHCIYYVSIVHTVLAVDFVAGGLKINIFLKRRFIFLSYPPSAVGGVYLALTVRLI